MEFEKQDHKSTILKNTNRFTHLEASAAQPVVEPLAVMSSLVGCQVWGHPAPHACWEVQLDSTGPSPSWDCHSRTVQEMFCLHCI